MTREEIAARLRDARPIPVAEFCRLTDYSRTTVHKLLEGGVLRAVGLGRSKRITVDSARKALRDLDMLPQE